MRFQFNVGAENRGMDGLFINRLLKWAQSPRYSDPQKCGTLYEADGSWDQKET